MKKAACVTAVAQIKLVWAFLQHQRLEAQLPALRQGSEDDFICEIQSDRTHGLPFIVADDQAHQLNSTPTIKLYRCCRGIIIGVRNTARNRT